MFIYKPRCVICMCFSFQAYWGGTMVQLIALLYKDQHAVTLHKLLNMWLEASLSESLQDNESNTSPPNRGSLLTTVKNNLYLCYWFNLYTLNYRRRITIK